MKKFFSVFLFLVLSTQAHADDFLDFYFFMDSISSMEELLDGSVDPEGLMRGLRLGVRVDRYFLGFEEMDLGVSATLGLNPNYTSLNFIETTLGGQYFAMYTAGVFGMRLYGETNVMIYDFIDLAQFLALGVEIRISQFSLDIAYAQPLFPHTEGIPSGLRVGLCARFHRLQF